MAHWSGVCVECAGLLTQVPFPVLLATVVATLTGLFVLVCFPELYAYTNVCVSVSVCLCVYVCADFILWQFYVLLWLVAPIPRKSLPEEQKYRTLAKDGSVTKQSLPCWFDSWASTKREIPHGGPMEAAELFMSVVVPAYNEEDRLAGMLEEAVNYLERMYGTLLDDDGKRTTTTRQRKPAVRADERGWEILIVSDGSKDQTEEMALRFARDHQLSLHPKGYAGPWTPKPQEGVSIPPGAIRVVSLAQNRGKGGAVTHGLRHVRGQYVVFADADGATKFDDLGKLVAACQEIQDSQARAVAVGSRAHMVGSEAVVKVSSSQPLPPLAPF